MTLDELRPRLHALPDRPDAVPYRTAYYERTWGFCLSQRALDAVAPGSYDVCVDTTLEPGSLTYGEVVIPGLTDDEILVSAHLCHPSLADDNLSGLSVAALLARELLAGPTPRHTIRFVFAPGTIGAITWLAQHRDHVEHIRHGLTLTCLGDGHPFTWKRTFGGSAAIDRAAAHVLATTDLPSQQIDWFPYGYDERQYGSPGFRLPVGSLMRGRHGQFPEYHTSMDDVAFVTAEHLGESIGVLRRLLRVVDQDRAVRSTQPYGEPQLGRRGLYRALGGTSVASSDLVMLWILALADGEHTLLDVADRASTTFESVLEITALLAGSGLVVDA
jgi:aminopeptidase-like protein